MVTGQFLNPEGLYALLSIVPLIILYLIKPKPKEKIIPSLMFFLKDRSKGLTKSFFRMLVFDFLFFIQLLAITMMALSIAEPAIDRLESSLVKHTVIVLDTSASMKVDFQGQDRFAKALSIALKAIGSKTTIIFASNIPEIVLENGDYSEAVEVLSLAKPKETSSNIYDAIALAGDIAKESNGRVVVLSDFIDESSDEEILTLKETLESLGAIVDYISVANTASNVGFIDLEIEEDRTRLWIKNYNKKEKTSTLKIGDSRRKINLKPVSTEIVSFPSPKGALKIELEPRDDFMVDNNVFISTPEENDIKALMVTNSPGKFLKIALNLIDTIDLETVSPPKRTEINHDVIIFNNVDQKFFLPGTVKEVSDRVKKGSSLIMIAQDDLFAIDFLGMSPVNYIALKKERISVIKEQEAPFTKDVDFGVTTKYLEVTPKEGTTVLASSESGVPIIAYKKHGQGNVIYYGLYDDLSDFKGDLYYPIFWKRLIDFLTGSSTIKDMNFKTGKAIALGREQIVRTPVDVITTSTLWLDRVGLFHTSKGSLAANLLSDVESNVNGFIKSEIGKASPSSRGKGLKPQDITPYVIALGLFLVLAELFFIKYRGDI